MLNYKSILKLFVLLIVLFNGTTIVFSQQETYDFPTVDLKTYNSFIARNWKDVIRTGKKSRKAGLNFYYLHVRMGIAYYNQKKYRQAIPYLETAFYESIDNEFVGEYLYYAYLLSGRVSDAQKLIKKFSREFKEKSGIRLKTGISGISFDTKFDNWDDYKINALSTDTLVQYVQEKIGYFSVGLENTFKNASKLNVNYSRVGLSQSYNDVDDDGTLLSDDQDIAQHQFYLGYGINVGKGLNLYLSANLIGIVSTKNELVQSSMGYGGGSGTGYKATNTLSMNYVVYAGLFKDFSLFNVGVFGSVSNLYKYFQLQPGASLTFYPLGNTNLYTYSTFNYQLEVVEGTRYKTGVFKQAIGFGLKGVYLEPSITFGELSDFVEAGGLVINNGNDIISDRYEILAYSYLFKGRLNLFVKYQNYVRRNYYLVNNQLSTINYNYQSIIGGLKWNF